MKLIPFVSTHFKYFKGFYSIDVTQGRIYKIEKWSKDENDFIISFFDNVGDLRHWTMSNFLPEDYTYYRNLEKILE